MYTTNSASGRLAETYVTLRAECESLLRLAKSLEGMALQDATFSENPTFQDLKGKFREQMQSVLSLASV